MKTILLILVSILITGNLSANEPPRQVSGCITDEKGETLPYANILVKGTTHGTASDLDGNYRLVIPKPGEYRLLIKYAGFAPFEQRVFLSGDTTINFRLKEDALNLNEVTVTAARPVIKRLVDRVVFDTHNAIATAGGNALDLLREVPGLRVGQNSIDIIGKGGVKVYINDRETKLSGDELIDYLRSYDASLIQKVEVITTPPSKYDAAGNAGIINIRLKSRPKDYLGGTVSTSYNVGEKENYGYGGVNLNISKGRVSSFVNAGTTQGNYETREANRRYFAKNTWDGRTDYKKYMQSYYGQAGVDVALERNWTVGLQAVYNYGNPKDAKAVSVTEVYDVATTRLDSLLFSDSKEGGKSDRLNLNFHTDKTWGDKGKKMTWDVDYLHDNRDSHMGFLSETQTPDGVAIPGTNFDYSYLQDRKVDVFSSALDFTLPFEKYKVTARR